MDTIRLSRFPHLAWLRFRLAGSPRASMVVLSMESVCHAVCCTFRGRHDIRQVTRGREASWREDAGSVNVLPQDGVPQGRAALRFGNTSRTSDLPTSKNN